MDIQAFLQLSCGQWLSQRTCHPLGQATSAAQTAQLNIEALALDNADVANLCKTASVDPDFALCAAKLSWESTGFQVEKPEQGTLLMVPISSTHSGQQGQILQQVAQGPIYQLDFKIDPEEHLILTGMQEQLFLEEKIWFASPNLRLRLSLLNRAEQVHQGTWYSEVRMGVRPQTPATEEVATSSP